MAERRSVGVDVCVASGSRLLLKHRVETGIFAIEEGRIARSDAERESAGTALRRGQQVRLGPSPRSDRCRRRCRKRGRAPNLWWCCGPDRSRVGHIQFHAAGHDRREADVVAADAEGDQRGIGSERGQLRRVDAVAGVLRRGQAADCRAATADVTDPPGLQPEVLGKQGRIVAVGALAPCWSADLRGNVRAGGVRVAERSSDATLTTTVQAVCQ